MHYWGFSCPKKRLLPGLRPCDLPLPKKFTLVLGFKFWPLGDISLLVTPIFGYIYVRISNNK